MKPRIRLHRNGRISFPSVVEYRVRVGDERYETLPYPPTYDSHPAKPVPVPLSSTKMAKMIALGEIKPLPCSLPYTIEELDVAACRRLAATGLLYDPRHTGHAHTEAVDNRPTS